MLTIESGTKSLKIEPGAFRSSQEHNVVVGHHIPPSGDSVGNFMRFFEERYSRTETTLRQIMAIPAAHHRLLYIHPFLNGNGRVGRIMSYAMCLKAGLGSVPISKVLFLDGNYKRMMSLADMKRQGDYDGRGGLSLKSLVAFTDWFLKAYLNIV